MAEMEKVNALVKERDDIDAKIKSIEGLKDRRKAINTELSTLMGLGAKRGRKAKA